MIHILVVDDEEGFTDITQRILKKIPNAETHIANNAEEAIKLIEAHAPEICFLDFNLNEHLSGLDLFKKAQKKNPKAIGILVTGNFAVEMRPVCDAMGFSMILEKPVLVSKILEVAECYVKMIQQGS